MKRVILMLFVVLLVALFCNGTVFADVTVTSAGGDVITFTDEEIGSIAAGGKQPFKGKEVAIEGKLTSRSYETKEGEKRYITEVVCNELLMLGK